MTAWSYWMDAASDAIAPLAWAIYALLLLDSTTGLPAVAAHALLGIGVVVLLYRLARSYLYHSKSSVYTVERDIAVEKHPDGCMCPFCCAWRRDQGLPIDPHTSGDGGDEWERDE